MLVGVHVHCALALLDHFHAELPLAHVHGGRGEHRDLQIVTLVMLRKRGRKEIRKGWEIMEVRVCVWGGVDS